MLQRAGRGLILTVALSLAALLGPVLSASAATSAATSAASAAAPTSPGTRIVAVAKRYVGKARYRDGGGSPKRGFDCSGYTAYAFRTAKVASLPHSAEQQRHARRMHRITATAARPGDLVFYLSGGRAYHVAIYAGKHMQYAAATPRDGIQHQRIWSRHVEYRTNWH